MTENNKKKQLKINVSNIRTVSDIRLILELIEFNAEIEEENLKKFNKQMVNLAYQRKILEK